MKFREVKNAVPKSTKRSRLELESRVESRSIGPNPFQYVPLEKKE